MTKGKNTPVAAIFDVDGTLVDTYRLYLESYRRALAGWLDRVPELEEFATKRPSSELHFLAEWIGEGEAAKCHVEMIRHYESLHATHCDGLYDGVREMLQALRAARVPLGVVTGKGVEAWRITERELGLGDFDVVVCEADVPAPKPDPAGLLLALDTLGVRPDDALYVGDSLTDLEAGRAAGVRVGAALWPKTDPADRAGFLQGIARWDPDRVFERPADVTRLFVTWC